MSIRSLSTSTLTSQTRYANMSGVFGEPPYQCEYLVVAGGGGAGGMSPSGFNTGGSGAGGYRTNVTGESSGGGASAEDALNLSRGFYSLTVGAGGPGTTSNGFQGESSVFALVETVGGGLSPTGNAGGGNGGSGGGASGQEQSGGTGVTGEGRNGASSPGGNNRGGGGGGASGNGSIQNGGSGVSSSITGSSVTRAGGGGAGVRDGGAGAGTGGAGGGGDSGYCPTGTPGGDGEANKGAGGGGVGRNTSGSGSTQPGGNGGSGVVIFTLPSEANVIFDPSHVVNVSSVGSNNVYEVTAGDGEMRIF